MILTALKPRRSLNKTFLKVKTNRSDIELFKHNLITLLDSINEGESEEFHKNLVSDFLKETYYRESHFINTKGRNDLVIHNGKTASTTVGVIIETKKPDNKSEMIACDNINRKAFQELALYYMRERITLRNLEIKHLIATNIYEWYIFDVSVFERLFARNKQFEKQFADFESGRLADIKTDFFYNQVAAPFIESLNAEIEFTFFDLRHYNNALRNKNRNDDAQLIALYKLLSPEHLLKLPFANDSNSLDKRFYSELLHIIGLTETKQGGKKLIERNKAGERNSASLLESAIIQLDSLDKLSRIEKPSQYGANSQERLFNIALELVITWINRILFLKLLEAQLLKYQRGNKAYAFLNGDKIKNYDDLNTLFFQVLARRETERNSDVSELFALVPYLNSSLFEPTDLEHQAIFISNLRDDKTIPVFSQTVLKDDRGRKIDGRMITLHYLFSFLDAYDFSSEGSEEIQEENKTLINASVLGLIFEKINGYKDGSFFTPGFITMYMSRETIRRAVVQKFNEAKGWDCTEIADVYDRIEDRGEANRIVNSIRIVDPAVGSGHFLVSALNEIIAIKNDLRILQDRDGRRLKEYHVEVVNDELIVTDDDGGLFEYNPNNRESQRVQEALFHEKQTIIENCLFGVDINNNSVKICRLRLWIELLKNAYYKAAGTSPTQTRYLETLPNIDINIKNGNSLVSRFALGSDLKKALRSSKWGIESYRIAVATYRNAENKEQKRTLKKLISDIKSDFRSEIAQNDPMVKRLNKLRGEIFEMSNQGHLFEMSKTEKAAFNNKLKKLTEQTGKLETEIEEIKNNKIYENAFEWRFEFPEALNDDGDFVGFDVVIGNPPYMRIRDVLSNVRDYYFQHYYVAENQLDLYHLFIEKSHQILKKEGTHSFIVPNAFLANHHNIKLRNFILNNYSINKIIEIGDNVFEEASVEVLIFIYIKNTETSISEFLIANNGQIIFKNKFDSNSFKQVHNNNFTVTISPEFQKIINKITKNSTTLQSLFETITGIKEYQVGKGTPPQVKEQVTDKVFNSNEKKDSTYLPELRGRNLIKYSYKWDNEFISYGEWLAEPRSSKYFDGKKILIRQIPTKTSFIASYVSEKFIVDQSTFVAKPKNELDIFFYLAVLNSKLLFWYFQNINNEFDQLFPKIKISELNLLPLPANNKCGKEISNLVKEIITIKRENPTADTTALEAEIDRMVYELYGLTEEEIEIVEKS